MSLANPVFIHPRRQQRNHKQTQICWTDYFFMCIECVFVANLKTYTQGAWMVSAFIHKTKHLFCYSFEINSFEITCLAFNMLVASTRIYTQSQCHNQYLIHISQCLLIGWLSRRSFSPQRIMYSTNLLGIVWRSFCIKYMLHFWFFRTFTLFVYEFDEN